MSLAIVSVKQRGALLRPAQKGLKTILTGGHATQTLKTSLNPPPSDNSAPFQPVATKKTLTKRSTTVFKDNRLGVVVQIYADRRRARSCLSVRELDDAA